MRRNIIKDLELIIPFGLMGFVLSSSCMEFYQIAWGTGKQVGEFSLTWLLLFLLYTLFCILLLCFFIILAWRRDMLQLVINGWLALREGLGWSRMVAAIVVLMIPGWLLQYTSWGIIFHGTYIRCLIWLLSVFLFSVFSTRGNVLIGWSETLTGLVLSASVFSILVPLQNAHDYPFSLGWSEGNRMWDYSIMFGRSLYEYPSDQEIPVLLDQGRQFLGGLPFLFPGLSITMERLYLGLVQILPYFLVGIFAFRKFSDNWMIRIIFVLWTFLFLRQGPIHVPLILCAAMTVLSWRSSYWIAIPLIIFSGYFAQASRFTWLFAPAIWIVLLEYSSAALHYNKVDTETWIRTAALGLAGVFGGYLLPKLLAVMNMTANNLISINLDNVGETLGSSGLTVEQVSHEVTHQPLLWYRLLPNSTYGNGILLGLLFAIGPLALLVLYLGAEKYWKTNIWQKLSIILPLSAFLVVGLVASTKIGGGGDLHNMDMFLVGAFFTGVVAWHNSGTNWIKDANSMPWFMRAGIVFWLIVVTIDPLVSLRSQTFGEQVGRLKTLADAPSETALGMLPDSDQVNDMIDIIQKEVDRAKLLGDVLFIDQRQLLTFGYIKNVPFVPEYEKKMLMNEALARNNVYFHEFYKDLAVHRFSLIISEPLRTPVQDSSFQFGEENNAWVEYVSIPVLCYYDPKITLKNFRIQLLIPKKEFEDCSSAIPK